MRKKSFTIIVLLAGIFFLSCAREKSDRIVVSAPFGPLVYPLVYMVENQEYFSFDGQIELKIWKNPDQLRAMVAGGQADFFAVPTNVAAVFHNKGAGVTLINVSVWSVLWIVSNDSTKKTLSDFKGEKIVMPFRGDMPHIVFSNLAKERGLDPENDFTLFFVNTPQDAVQQLMTGRAGHAVLCEPDISILLYKSHSLNDSDGMPPRFFRSVDLQKEWGKVYHTGEELPIGGTAITTRTALRPELIAVFQKEYARAIEWCINHPEETAELVARRFEGVQPEPIAEAMKHVSQKFVTAGDARPALETFFSVLYEGNPASIGGAMPGDGFYWE